MAIKTAIGWCDATVNFWWGCTKVSPACDHCYAEAWAKRLGKDLWGNGKARQQIAGATALAFKLERKAVRATKTNGGRRLKVFSNSMSDFFDSEVPDEWRDHAMAVIALTPHLDWLVLTKRPKVARGYIEALMQETQRATLKRFTAAARALGETSFRLPPSAEVELPLDNLWVGVTAEDQKMADLRLPDLLATPAAKRFVSIEPLLGPVDIRPYMPNALWNDLPSWKQPELDWVIAGGESGKDARPMHPDWARALRDQCEAAGVPFFFKQWGEWAPSSDVPVDVVWRRDQATVLLDGRVREWEPGFPEARLTDPRMRPMTRLGTKRAGSLLDGKRHEAFPA